MSGKIIDLDSERTIRAGEQACNRWLASDPKLCEQAARYAAARAKLREGMRENPPADDTCGSSTKMERVP